MQEKYLRLWSYALGHFWVDFSCALLLFSRLSGQGEWALCVLLYNFCAFALQMPIGVLAGRWRYSGRVATFGCILAALGWGLAPVPAAAAVTAGLGNACFHVGGGMQILEDGEKKAASLGIFVSPGAFGIYFGALLEVPALLPAVGLLLFALWFHRLAVPAAKSPEMDVPDQNALWALMCFFLVVVLRSYLGMVLSFPWKTGGWNLGMLCAVVLGKAAGGFLGDCMGMRRTAAISLGLAAVFFCLSDFPLAGITAVFFFNMTMPITLWAAARLLPAGKGFAFGLLTFALFIGFLPVWLGWPLLLAGGTGYAAGAACSLALLALGLRKGGL